MLWTLSIFWRRQSHLLTEFFGEVKVKSLKWITVFKFLIECKRFCRKYNMGDKKRWKQINLTWIDYTAKTWKLDRFQSLAQSPCYTFYTLQLNKSMPSSVGYGLLPFSNSTHESLLSGDLVVYSFWYLAEVVNFIHSNKRLWGVDSWK